MKSYLYTTILLLILSFFSLNDVQAHKRPLPTKIPVEKTFLAQYENVLGTSFEMKVFTPFSKKAKDAEKVALNEIDRLSKILSGYDPNSEFSLWMQTQNKAVKVSAELIEVLNLFDTWTAKTHGAINPAFQSMSQLWKDAAKHQLLPTTIAIQNTVQVANQQHWLIDQKNATVTHLTSSPLLLNTFVKSYIIDRATQKALSETGVQGIVMNIGGDIRVAGNVNETVEITNPRATAINDTPLDRVSLQEHFIATSGNYRRGFQINDKWYSHIIDPRTGLPVDHVISATVIAKNATDAGALATAFNILSVSESIALAKQIPDVAYLIITKEGMRIQSNNWHSLEKNEDGVLLPVIKADQWDPTYELLVNLELAKFEGRSHRPFVAIWVEDKEKMPVRTLTVWYNKPRWLHDLRAWYSANYSKYNAESGTIASISSATRSAGQYAIKWDGKDDQGQLVKTGTYTIKIEVAREHGTYQLMTQEIKVNNKAQQFDLGANTEVVAASIVLKKKEND